MDDRGGGSFVAVRRVAPRLEQGSVYHSSSSGKISITTLLLSLHYDSLFGTNAFSSLSLSHTFLPNFYFALTLSFSLSLFAGDYLFFFLRFGAADLVIMCVDLLCKC